jgi:hypothetical protein
MVIGTSAIVFAAAAAVGVIFAFAIARRMRRHAAGKAVRAICGMGGSGMGGRGAPRLTQSRLAQDKRIDDEGRIYGCRLIGVERFRHDLPPIRAG